jgi:mRNA-degrading endonuclease toxin of MazEF toxin-antitoxin module
MSRSLSSLAGFQVTINGRFWLTAEESVALCEQVRTISKVKLDNVRLAHVTPTAIASVETGLAYVLGIP